MPVRLLPLLIIVTLVGCAGGPPLATTSFLPPPGHQSLSPRALVFCVDGAGNYQGASKALKGFVAEENLPIHVETFEWSHGYRRIFADLLDQEHADREGRRLAEAIQCYRQPADAPPLPITIIAHSAGSHAALCVGKYLPPDSVERIILLAPSVSRAFDIRPALRCATQGVDVFYSRADRGYLGLGTRIFGTSDGRRVAVSGRVGFDVPTQVDACDAGIFTRLHQHPWNESLRSTGHDGGHYGSYQPAFLKSFVVPLILPTTSP